MLKVKKKTLKDLQKEAAKIGLRGRSKLKRDELEEAIRIHNSVDDNYDTLNKWQLELASRTKNIKLPFFPTREEIIKKLRENPRPTHPSFQRPPPTPPPRKNRKIMNTHVPKQKALVLEPEKVPLRPPRPKRQQRKLQQEAEKVTNWFDWLRNSGQ